MNKKILGIGLTILVLGALVFTVGGSVFAQEDTPEVEVTELPDPVVTRRGRAFGAGTGVCDGTCDADGDGIPGQLQLRLQDGTAAGMQNGFGYGPGDGTCDGTCDADGDGIPDQLRLRDGSGTAMQYGPGAKQGGRGQGAGQSYGPGNGEGFGPAEGQGFGPGNGQAMGQGGLRDGSCIDD